MKFDDCGELKLADQHGDILIITDDSSALIFNARKPVVIDDHTALRLAFLIIDTVKRGDL